MSPILYDNGFYVFSNRGINYTMSIADEVIEVWKTSVRGTNLSVYDNFIDRETRKPLAKFLKEIVSFISEKDVDKVN